MDFFPEIDVDKEQAEAIARGLYAVAKADGEVHPRELAIIADLFTETVESPSQLGALERSSAPDGAYMAAQLPSKELRQLFIKTAWLVAYADSNAGAAEKKLIEGYASALGIAKDELARLEQATKEYLLSQLSHLNNVAAAVEVAKELKA
jgi:tellurite resistance protein